MAGIGFELKKIFANQGVTHAVRGTLYAAMATIGPILLVVVGFVVLFFISGLQHAHLYQRDVLMAIILYTFIFSLVLTLPLSAVLSRYIADCIYEDRLEDVLSGYYAGLLLNMGVALLTCVPFLAAAVYWGSLPHLDALLAGMFFLAMVFLFYNMPFISALKEYRRIALAFVAGMGISVGLSYILVVLVAMRLVPGILLGIGVGFGLTAWLLYLLARNFFKTKRRKYTLFWQYLRRYKWILLGNAFYVLGLYVHNFVFWVAPPANEGAANLSVTVAQIFHMAPMYDVATFLAMLTSVPAMVIFVVRTEINFHEKYQEYCHQLTGGVGHDLEAAKKRMFSTLVQGMLFIGKAQLLVSFILYLVLLYLAPILHLGGFVLTLYPLLAAGFFVVYLMYFMVIFLHYFSDEAGVAWVTGTFFSIVLLVSVLCVVFSVPPIFYGAGLFAGAFAGWTLAFFRLKYIEKHLNHIIFGR